MSLTAHTTVEVVQLPKGAYFGQVAWAPDGKAIAYEAIVRNKSDDLFLAPLPVQRGPARNLGHWYQGFSFSPEGSRIVHATNNPFAPEALDVATANRTLLHKSRRCCMGSPVFSRWQIHRLRENGHRTAKHRSKREGRR